MSSELLIMFVHRSESISWKDELKAEKINWKKLIKKSEDFCTCAVAHQSAIIPRTNSGVPSCKELEFLGYDFMEACVLKDKKSCISVLSKINKLSAARSKECLSRIKKIFKKNTEALDKYINGERCFGVGIDKDGSIVSIKESAMYYITLPDSIEFIKDNNNENSNINS